MAKLARERRIIEKREAKREKKQAAAEAKAAGEETELSPEELEALNAPNEQGPDRPARDLSL